jgi:hypothetical protein
LSGMDGQCHKIKTSAATSVEIAKMWVTDKLPTIGGQTCSSGTQDD